MIPDPGNPLDWDRYQYVRSNPVRYTDPSGHRAVDCDKEGGDCKVDPEWQKAKGCGATFKYMTINGRGCLLYPAGTFHVTWYYTPIASEFGGGTIEVNIEGLGRVSLPRSAVLGDGMETQGSLKIGPNQYINSLVIGKRYTASLGFGRPGLRPFFQGAVGPSYFETSVYLPAFWNTPSDGLFFGADTGGKIVDGDLDIYIGEGNAAVNEALRRYSYLGMKKSGVFGDSGESNFPAYRAVCSGSPSVPHHGR
jgi:hypothetical protein